MSAEEILKLAKTIKPETLPEEWRKNEDMSMNYLGGFLTAFKYASQSTSVSTKANGEAEDVEALAEGYYKDLEGVIPNDTLRLLRQGFEFGYKAAQSTPKEADFEQIESDLVDEICQKFRELGIDTSEWEYRFGDGNTASDFIKAGIAWHLENTHVKEAPQVAVECYVKLIEAQDRYIGFISNAFNQAYSIAHVHRYRSSDEEIKEGQRLRDEIEQLKKTTLYTKP